MPNRDQLKEFFEQMIRPLRNRVYNIVSRAVIEIVKDSETMQTVKLNILADEPRDDIERFQNYGFTSVPPSGSEAIVVACLGNRDNLVVIACDDRRVRKKDLVPGDSAMYNSKGEFWHLKDNGTLEGKVKKLKIANATGEVIDLLVQMNTALKAEPFIVNKATFALIETKLLTFKV